MRCKAKSKRSGEQCKRHATPGMEVCYYHGGASLKGVASPSFKTGRYSKYLPARLMERYQESLSDPEILDLKSEISLIDSRVAEVLKTLDTGESGNLWRDLGKIRGRFLDSQRAKDKEGMAFALTDLLNAVGHGSADFERWGEVVDLLERRRRLVESEQKRLVAMQQMVTAEQAMGLLAALVVSLRELAVEYVDEDRRRPYLVAVQRSLDRLAGAGVGAEDR